MSSQTTPLPNAQAFRSIRVLLSYSVLIAIAVTTLVPFAWMVSTSLKAQSQVFLIPPQWIPDPVLWSNYADMMAAMPFGRYLFNSLFIAATVTLLELATSSLAGYSFARLRFPGRDRLFLLYLATLMIPGQVTLIPNFIVMRILGWIDTYYALIIPAAFSAFGTFLLRQFFLTIPYELEDAAKIDGAGYFGTYWRIILPLAKPALTTLAIFTFMAQWNSFLWPLIVTNSPEMRTLTVGLRMFQGQYLTRWPLLMAGTVFSLIPILTIYVIGQKYFVRGIALTGLAGR